MEEKIADKKPLFVFFQGKDDGEIIVLEQWRVTQG